MGARKLKRSGHTQTRRRALLLTAVLALPLAVMAGLAPPISLAELTERAALFSAMANMPQGSLALLEKRFAGQEDTAYYNSEESAVEPYLAPWQEKPPAPTPPAVPKPPTGAAAGTRPPIIPPSPARDTPPAIPEKYRGRLLQENMAGDPEKLPRYGDGLLRNYTEVPDDEVTAIMKKGLNVSLAPTDAPQVLIFHTHATESYEQFDSESYDMRNTWRSTANNVNMIAVGNALEKQLKDAGIGVIHDTTKHDYPSYNGAYERSAVTIQKYLKQYPTIKIALDVHRDAIQREEDLIVKPVVEINGRKAAQLMIITGSDDGTMDVPNWRENLRFAAAVQNAIEQDYPHLTRPIFFCYRKYNMDLTNGSLLFEVGANGNTLAESVYTAELVGKSLAKLLKPATPASVPLEYTK